MSVVSGLLRPEVERHLLESEREFIVDQVGPHLVTRLPGTGIALLGIALLLAMPWLGAGWPVGLALGLGLGLQGLWKVHVQNMDRFVVTNMRVFRVHGVINQHLASVPIIRILDISVEQPLLGQILNYGHFVFESAAQDQGLKRIQYVPDIELRDLIIQTVIQRAGLRARMGIEKEEFAELLGRLGSGSGRPAGVLAALRRRRAAGRRHARRGTVPFDDGT
jgi:hypothetical protein